MHADYKEASMNFLEACIIIKINSKINLKLDLTVGFIQTHKKQSKI